MRICSEHLSIDNYKQDLGTHSNNRIPTEIFYQAIIFLFIAYTIAYNSLYYGIHYKTGGPIIIIIILGVTGGPNGLMTTAAQTQTGGHGPSTQKHRTNSGPTDKTRTPSQSPTTDRARDGFDHDPRRRAASATRSVRRPLRLLLLLPQLGPRYLRDPRSVTGRP